MHECCKCGRRRLHVHSLQRGWLVGNCCNFDWFVGLFARVVIGWSDNWYWHFDSDKKTTVMDQLTDGSITEISMIIQFFFS